MHLHTIPTEYITDVFGPNSSIFWDLLTVTIIVCMSATFNADQFSSIELDRSNLITLGRTNSSISTVKTKDTDIHSFIHCKELKKRAHSSDRIDTW